MRDVFFFHDFLAPFELVPAQAEICEVFIDGAAFGFTKIDIDLNDTA
jgi:hypothetical protein